MQQSGAFSFTTMVASAHCAASRNWLDTITVEEDNTDDDDDSFCGDDALDSVPIDARKSERRPMLKIDMVGFRLLETPLFEDDDKKNANEENTQDWNDRLVAKQQLSNALQTVKIDASTPVKQNRSLGHSSPLSSWKVLYQ